MKLNTSAVLDKVRHMQYVTFSCMHAATVVSDEQIVGWNARGDAYFLPRSADPE